VTTEHYGGVLLMCQGYNKAFYIVFVVVVL